MILKSLKRRSNQIFLKNNYNSFISNSKHKAPEKLSSILFVVDQSSNLDEISKNMKKVIGVKDSQITFVFFSEKANKNSEREHHVSEKDFGWYGKVDEGFLKQVLTNTYDLLINHSKVESLYADMLVLQVKAGLKVGFGTVASENYDLKIQVDASDTALFTSELKKYLEILK